MLSYGNRPGRAGGDGPARPGSLPGWARPSGLYSALLRSRWGSVALTRALPASFFAFMLAAKVAGFVTRLQTGPGDAPPLSFWIYVLQQALAIGFLTVVVALFLARAPVVGRHSSALGAVVALTSTFLFGVVGTARVPEDQPVTLLLSSALLLAGNGFAIVSLVALGRCFGLMPEARGLITRGPYRWVRHPVYLGEMIAALGLVVAAASLANFGLFFLSCALQYWRAIMEERTLMDAFPEYATYRQRTHRVIPGVH